MKKSLQKIWKIGLGLLVITSLHHIASWAQESNTKLIIIKEHTDKDGNKTVERIVKEGPEADAFDMEKWREGAVETEIKRWKEDQSREDGQMHFKQFKNDDGSFGQSIIIGEDSIILGDIFNFKFDFDNDAFPFLKLDDFSPNGFAFPGLESKPRLGIRIEDIENQSGVLVREVMEGSVAQAAGMREGDIILSINDQSVNSGEEVIGMIQKADPGSELMIDILRDREHMQIVAQLEESPNKKDNMIIKKL